jgi:Ca2+-transporting ATPase
LADAHRDEVLGRLLRVATLCNEVDLRREAGELVLEGSETEKALVRLALDAGVEVEALRTEFPVLKVERRAERRAHMSTLHTTEQGTQLVAAKGRPDDILARCERVRTGSGVRELTEADRLELEAQNERLTAGALRVMALAEGMGGEEQAGGLTWLGLVGIMDPPRAGIDQLIQRLGKAGIRTIMITGDQSATAYAVAREINLGQGEELQILDATRLETMEPAVLQSLVHRVHIFSRVSPSNKLQIVRALQAAGLVVAMTGDGVNDGPALHAADVGISLGKQGSDVAREVADIVLMNDDIAGLPDAIAVGRLIADDLRRALRYVSATNLSEIQLTIAGFGLGLGEALTPRQLLWLNLLTDVFPELALAAEPAHLDILSRPPTARGRALISGTDATNIIREASVITTVAAGGWLYGRGRYGPGAQANAVAFSTLSAAQLLHTISARSRRHTIFHRTPLPRNQYVLAAVTGGLGLEVMLALIRAAARLAGVVPISLADLAISWALAGGSLVANETFKLQAGASEAREEEQ